jgi:hypothetical protein
MREDFIILFGIPCLHLWASNNHSEHKIEPYEVSLSIYILSHSTSKCSPNNKIQQHKMVLSYVQYMNNVPHT